MSLGCPELSPCYSGILVVTPPRQGSSRARWGFFMSGAVKDSLTARGARLDFPEKPKNPVAPQAIIALQSPISITARFATTPISTIITITRRTREGITAGFPNGSRRLFPLRILCPWGRLVLFFSERLLQGADYVRWALADSIQFLSLRPIFVTSRKWGNSWRLVARADSLS